MLCIASIVIYLSYNYAYTFESKHKRIGVFKVYAISSLIAGLMASFFWLPALKAFSGGGRLNQTTASEYQFSENMPFVQIFAKLFTGANSALEEIQGLPNIFCGIIVVALVILFFMNKNICLKYKRSAAVVLTLYLLSFYIKAFTLVMHGFTHTNWFPYRYSFVFSFFLIWISVYEFKYIEQIGISDIKRCGIIILLSSIVIFSNRYEFISGGDVLIDLLILSLIFFIFYFWKTHQTALINKIAIYLLAFLVFVNLFANYIISIKKLQKEDGWELDIETYQNNTLLSGALIDGINGFDSDFFRMEKDFSESESIGADPLLYNYNGVSGSGPTIRAFVHKELNKLGINWFDMRHWYSKGIPAATDALLGLKYLLSDKDLTEEKGYEQLVNIGESFIYKNPYALSIAILSDTEAERLVLNNNIFENLNNIWKSMVRGSKNIFVEEKDITFTLYNSKAGRTITSEELSSSVSNSIAESVAALDSTHSISSNTNEEPTMSYIESKFIAKHDGPVYYFDQSVPASNNGRSVPCIEFVGMFKKGDIVTHHFIVGDDITWQKMMEYASTLIYAYANNDVLSEYAAILNQNDLTLQVPHENNLVGTFSADDNQCILFTMPWDEGWTCYIDGQKATINKTWNLFMSVDVPKGQHTYEMKFFPAWMDYGIIISVAALIVLIIFMFHWNNTHSISRYILSHNSITDEDSCDLNNTDNSIIISDSIELVKESETNIENYTNEGIK